MVIHSKVRLGRHSLSFVENGEVRPVGWEKWVELMGSVEGSFEVGDFGFRVLTICFVGFISSSYQMLKCYQTENPTAGLIPGWM